MEPMCKRDVLKERLSTSTLSPMTGCVVLMMEGVLELSKWVAIQTLTTPPCPRLHPSISATKLRILWEIVSVEIRTNFGSMMTAIK